MLTKKTILQKTGLIALALLIAAAGILTATRLSKTQLVTRTWTVNNDFNQGVLQGVEYTTVADQLQLSKGTSTFPIMWVANAGEDTVSKIDTNTGRELARYRTWFNVGTHDAWTGPAPSRTAVDSDGNVYVLNRVFPNLTSTQNKAPLLMKILATGGIDRNGNGQIDTSVDSDNNGVISGTEMKGLTDTNGNGIVDAADLQDERIVWVAQVGDPASRGMIGRSLAMGIDGNVWVGTWGDRKYYKVSSANGALLAGPYSIPFPVNGPYGSAMDSNGILWSASISDRLGKLDPATGNAWIFQHAGNHYGITVGGGQVYLSSYGGGRTYVQFDPATSTFSYPAWSKGVGVNTFSVGIDQNGDIFVTELNGAVRKFKPDGTQIWAALPQQNTDSRGAIIDSNGDVWVNHLGTNRISKFRGTDGAPLGHFPIGYRPYTYSDATGLTALSTTTPTGYWTVIQDGGGANTTWGKVSWQGAIPNNTSLEMKVRAANTIPDLEFQTYQIVSNGIQFSATGQYIQIQVKFSANQAGTSPILYDLTVESLVTNQPPTANAGGPYNVPEGGSVVLNGSGSDPDGDPLVYSWDLDNNGVFETLGQNPTFSAAGRDGPGSQIVVLKVSDNKGASATSSATVNIQNVAPVITGLTAPLLVVLGSPLNLNGTFTDAGIPDTHTASANWGDTTSSAATVTEAGGSGSFTAQHTYAAAQFYTIAVTVTDDDGGTAVQTIQVAVTATGKMTGGGRVESGAAPPPAAKGKPQAVHTTHGFELVLNADLSRSGNLQYNDHRNGDNFHATSVTSLVLVNDPALNPGNPAAMFDTAYVKGVGRLNGVDGVPFAAVITDNGEPGRTDKFTISFPGGQSPGISGVLSQGNHQAHPLP
ncbi:MAG: hypothetical protein HY673_15965 [Chloroflexi bacterium]|nr:hypothetical protein [Chloroflexota bacterium]